MRYFIFLIFLGLCACSSDKKEVETAPREVQNSNLLVKLDRVRLRQAPGEDGAVLKELSKGTRLTDLAEVSNFTTTIKLNGVQYDEPWLNVKTEDGTSGWVYAATIELEQADTLALANFLKEKRLLSLFGKENTKRIQSFADGFNAPTTAASFATLYREGIQLRDDLLKNIDERLENSSTEELPDLFWLKGMIPGFVPQLVAEGTSYYLFADYKAFGEIAGKTESTLDDEFIELQYLTFPEDSIEYFFPAWMIQTWDYGGHSLFGRKIHQSLLFEIDQLHQKDTLFHPEILVLKDRLVEDMTGASVGYWESADKIIPELDTILNADLTIFTKNDKIALETRRKQFDQPEEHGIRANLRAGTF